MPLRLFVWYCAVSGAGSALAGWALGQVVPGGSPLLAAALRGMLLGMLLALALTLVDSGAGLAWSPWLAHRATTALVAGAFGGFLGGLLVQARSRVPVLAFTAGWGVTGLAVGAAPGLYDLLQCVRTRSGARDPARKVMRGLLAGGAGGLVGGLLALALAVIFQRAFAGKSPELLWAPGASGAVALGVCIGLAVGFATRT